MSVAIGFSLLVPGVITFEMRPVALFVASAGGAVRSGGGASSLTWAAAAPDQRAAARAIAATGRLSSTDPNLQNIPVRTPEGRRIRQAFVAPPGHVLVAADYSQIELRIMAHLSGDESLLRAFAEDRDIADSATLAAIATARGRDAAALAARAEAPDIAMRYKMLTQEAIDRGVFGAPTYVCDGELFWGQDRLDFLDRALAK